MTENTMNDLATEVRSSGDQITKLTMELIDEKYNLRTALLQILFVSTLEEAQRIADGVLYPKLP